MMKKILYVVIGVVLFTALLEAKGIEPFGIKFNQPINKAIVYTDIADSNMKMIDNPPKPVSLFNVYAVSLNQSKKVIQIVGLGKTYKDEDYCLSSQADFTKIENILTKKYGLPSKSSNYLFHDSIWKDLKDYKMSFVKNERSHYASWDMILEYPNIEIYLAEDADRTGCFVKLVYKDKQLSLEQKQEKDKSDINSF